MSGFQPIQFVKESSKKEEKKEETAPGAEPKMPLTAENVMSEKDKVAAALVRGEDCGPFGVAGAFSSFCICAASLPWSSAECEHNRW